ncbi:MAG: hypothetical protein QUS09_07945, partial [Methanotrichaceae archaeon]|nr:hypothetical protein [Methanotrichaceae archaeon]
LFFLAYPAFAGQGCGTNWLGSDVNDKDFWVSKNQNKGISSPSVGASTASVSTASSSVSTATIGSGKSSQSSLIQGLSPDKQSPQMAGAVITWTANATGSQEGVLYKFLLKGPSTEGMAIEKTGWQAENTWTWNTTPADVGENQIEVRVRSGKYIGSDPNGFDESKSAKFVVTTEDAEEVAQAQPKPVDPNPHPKARTADTNSKVTKPRLAPDERPRPPPGNPNGPNMSMPDPTPKPLVKAEDTVVEDAAVEDFPEVEAPVETSEPSVLDMSGKWTIKFEGLGSSLELVLIQTGERIMGSGTLSEGKTKIPVTASGSVSRNRLELDVKTVVGDYVNQIDKSYNVKLAESDGTFTGSYEAYEGEKFISEGNATAVKPGL